MTELAVVATRGEIVESVHRVSAAIVGAQGRVLAHAGDPALVTYWRSASKPFQLYPLVADGGAERFGLDRELLALACASHNAEPVHREVGARWLAAIGLPESALHCGGHPSLSPEYAEVMIREGVIPTPLWSNCSGKHAALLAMAVLHDWPTEGYQAFPHPVQLRVRDAIAAWTDLSPGELVWGIDGCTAAAVALPLTAMATGYARLGMAGDPGLRRIRDAMLGEPFLIAGTGRLDTALMEQFRGRIIAKIGAGGVYSVALPELELGIALKVEDGDGTAAAVALMGILEQVTEALAGPGAWSLEPFDRWHNPPIRNTRGAVTGTLALRGGLAFT